MLETLACLKMMTIVMINLDGDQYWRKQSKYDTRTANIKPADCVRNVDHDNGVDQIDKYQSFTILCLYATRTGANW